MRRRAGFPNGAVFSGHQPGRLPVCPACDSEIEMDELDVDEGDVIGCPECGIELRVVSTSPIQLDLATEEAGW